MGNQADKPPLVPFVVRRTEKSFHFLDQEE